MRVNRLTQAGAGVAALVGFLLALKPLQDFDNDWHLAAGRWMWEHKSFITTDPFSYTFFGKPWVSITWGHELYTYFWHSLFGDAGLVLATALLSALTMWFLFKATLAATRDESPWSVGGVLAALIGVAFLSAVRWNGRPEMWSHLCGAGIISVICGYFSQSVEGRRTGHRLLWMIAFQAVWVNAHGVFIMGPIFALMTLGLVALDAWLWDRSHFWDDVKPALWAALGVGAVCLVNPRGLRGALFPFHLLQVLKSPVYARSIPEGVTPFDAGFWRFDAYELLIAMGVSLSLMLLGLWRGRNDRASRLYLVFGIILWGGLSYLSVAAKRNIPLLVLWGAPFALYGLWKSGLDKKKFCLCGLALALVTVVARGEDFFLSVKSIAVGGFRAWDEMPEGAAKFVETHDVSGPSFATDTVANYFLRRLPGYRSFIDSRFAEVYDLQHFERYMNILAAPQLLGPEIEKYNIDNVILGLNVPFAHGMMQFMAGDSRRWALVYFDHVSAIFVRRDVPRYQAWIARAEAEQKGAVEAFVESLAEHPPSEARLVGMGRTLSLAGDVEAARKVFDRAVEIDPRNYSALAGLCNVEWMGCASKKDEVDLRCAAQAYDTCNDAMRLNVAEVPPFFTAALAAQSLGHTNAAATLLEHCIKIDPISFESHWTLARVRAGDFKKAPSEDGFASVMREYMAATRLRPNNSELTYEMAEFLDGAGNADQADEAYRRVAQLGAPDEILKKIQKRFEGRPVAGAGAN